MHRPVLAPLGLTYTQYLVMLLLWQRPAATMGELAEHLHLESGTLSPLLKRLEQAGLVDRGRSPDDERVLEVSATDAGHSLRCSAAHVAAWIVQATGMTAREIDNLHDTVQVLTMRLSTAEAPAAPPLPARSTDDDQGQ